MKKTKSVPKKAGAIDIEPSSHIEEEATPPVPSFPIVGIGASAGGLAAFEAFFSGMPAGAEPGIAFVLVQHLAPDHKSILAELVRRYTPMRVFEVQDGMIVEPNCAYIIPPGYDMAFFNGALQLFEPSAPRGQRLPIDFFFRSLAQDQGDRAIGIVLSGTGSDGTLGVRAIKGGGGMVMVQTPESTEYDGMPRSVIATGLADYELLPNEMAAALIAFTSRAFKKNKTADAKASSEFENSLKKIFILVRSHTGHDFSSYKSNTINRRIERRMAVHQINTIDEYLKFLQQSKEEIDALFKDLLISVTNFFRDIESFKALEDAVIPKLFSGKKPGDRVRVWSAGCSTGEEAYSIAILLQEHMDSIKQSFTVQVFATDIDSQAIAMARTGIYPASIATDVSPERLSRYFTAEPYGTHDDVQSYRINKNIRDMLIFSEQNVIKDPPFSKLDLICCRNLMIYLSGDLQKKLIPLFHYALNPGGFLFLGTSETVGEYSALFHSLDRKSKLYMRKENVIGPHRPPSGSILPVIPYADAAARGKAPKRSMRPAVPLRELAEQTLLKQLAPASALVNSQGDIFYLHGRTGMYLEPAIGEVGGYNIIKMAREGLRQELTAALRKAVQDKKIVRCPNLSVKTNGSFTLVDLRVCPVAGDGVNSLSDQLYLVILEEGKPLDPGHDQRSSRKSSIGADGYGENSAHNSLIASLKEELRIKEEYLQAANEELETSNEELKSSNEEMQSINEELQSTNEELETSKEELQSVNEELSTVNSELSIKVADLSRANNDMNNLLAGTGIATVFVDHQLCILRFTPTVNVLINLIQSDVGRPVNHILTNLIGYDSMSADIQSVLDTLIPKAIEVQTEKGDWFRMNIQPYRTIDNVIEGAVINFFDITELKHYQGEIKKQLSEKEALLKEVHHRVKNNIASIESLLSLQAHSAAHTDVKNALKDTISRIRSMRVLYEKLLIGKDYEVVSIKKYVESLIDSFVAVFPESNKVFIDRQITDFTLIPKIAIPVGIIINELLTNTFKYAFKDRDGGHISVIIGKSENNVIITIHDNGTGIDERINTEKASGFGLNLVKMLAEQLHGTFNIANDNGTKCVIQFEI
ncbi:MAG: chemotaxis protein CheB [Spirochaetota bacterium]